MLETRIGIYGGSFDPIHTGHLFVASRALETFSLEKVFFVPAYIAPHKQDHKVVSSQHRLEMCHEAISGDPQLGVLDLEIRRRGTSYTVETLRELIKNPPLGRQDDVSLYFIIGSDSLAEFSTWREFQAISELSTLITVARGPGEADKAIQGLKAKLPETTLEVIRDHVLEVEPHPASSTLIRQNIRRGIDVGDWLIPSVSLYIERHQLYRD